VFWVISVYFNIRNTLPKYGTFLLGHLYMFSGTSAIGYRTQRETDKTHRFSPLLVSIYHCSRLVIYTLLLLEGKTGEALELSKKQCSFGYRGDLNRKVMSILETPS